MIYEFSKSNTSFMVVGFNINEAGNIDDECKVVVYAYGESEAIEEAKKYITRSNYKVVSVIQEKHRK